MIEVESYQDYRKFLKDFHFAKLNESKHWSVGVWCQQLGLSSTSTMNMILNEKRHAGQKVLDNLVRYFKFNSQEEEYFRTLVRIQKKLKDPQLMMVFWESYHQKKKQKGIQGVAQGMSKEQLDFRVQSMTYILRELVTLKGFKEDATWIREKLKGFFPESSRDYFQSYLSALKQQGYLRPCKIRKRLWPSQPEQTTKQERPSDEKIEDFHHSILASTKQALKISPKDRRTFQTSYLSISSANYGKAMSLITEFQDKFSELMEEKEGQGDSLCQLNLQLFEITSTDGKHSG